MTCSTAPVPPISCICNVPERDPPPAGPLERASSDPKILTLVGAIADPPSLSIEVHMSLLKRIGGEQASTLVAERAPASSPPSLAPAPSPPAGDGMPASPGAPVLAV